MPNAWRFVAVQPENKLESVTLGRCAYVKDQDGYFDPFSYERKRLHKNIFCK